MRVYPRIHLHQDAGPAVGMAVTGPNITAGSVIAPVDSPTQVTMSKPATGGSSASIINFTADVFKILLIKAAPSRTFDGSQTNIGTPGSGAPSATNVGTDEVSLAAPAIPLAA
jgi:hypothetical protein